ncbi:ABC transporter ATP-binding protein [Hymenobacter cellulosilyticus]|uniref:ABC transporter ATP-binding protein/permease n=1 Tax=Hymenobacter cellulosilyticus TaxID=2932248 RepID=A0A8T9QE45_9BACT|nr:ABC transporter ATP-binding protein [Hymenobacter cellulosilyticus]UOQ74418.1 ABC transporter ATP-binding protein/permease [Hymenobacter cellulosilyticus]
MGLASLVPIMVVAGEPNGIQKNKYFNWLFHTLNFESERGFLLFLIVGIFVFFLLKNAFSVWINYIQTKFTAEVGLHIIETQLEKYLNFPFWHFNDYGSASLVNSSIQVPSTYVNMVMRPLFIFFSELAIILVIVIGIMVYQPLLLAILVVVLAPTTWLTYRVLRTRSQYIGNRINDLNPISFATINDLFTGFVELRLANKQRRFRDQLLESQREIRKLDAEAYLYSLIPLRIIEMVAILGVVTIFLYSLFFANNSANLIALVGLFAAAAYRLMPSVNRILMSMVQIKQSQYAIENLENFRTSEYNEQVPEQQLPLTFNKSLELDHLSFAFPKEDRLVLQEVTLKIRKGEKIGFIGSSGSGKTTLMNVLLRFYTEQHGKILVDGQPLTAQHLQAWHSIIGYVKQDTFLMQASIKDNITLGDPVVDEARLQYAIEQASLQNFIQGLPLGADTLIGERGSKLSGGQRQRIGIARAMYKRTEILMLDEATSALDNETEREVNEAINKLSQTDMTILIIAHRITTLRECDRIYELNQGRIVAEHQYADLAHTIV